MKLIQLSNNHYIIVDASIQPVTGYYYDALTSSIENTSGAEYGVSNHTFQITHSTEPLELLSENGLSGMGFSKVRPLNVFEVKELLGVADVEKKAEEVYPQTYYSGIHIDGFLKAGYVKGYNQAIEDNKEKKYTEADIRKAIEFGYDLSNSGEYFSYKEVILEEDAFIRQLQPKTEWEVTIDSLTNKIQLI